MKFKQFLRKFYYSLSPAGRFFARRLYYLPSDLLRSSKDLVPPRGLIYTGSGDFKRQGADLLKLALQQGKLQPDHQVLDIGCGIGRFAIPLTRYLDGAGRYFGFDVVRVGIDWCQKNITSRFPEFQFEYIPLSNDLYRSGGKDAASFIFPYQSQIFDRVFLFSVFTHMQPAEVANYLQEISRVLKPGGMVLATFFLIDQTEKQMSNSDFCFPHAQRNHYLMNKKVKAANVAFKGYFIQDLAVNNNLEILDIYDGWWWRKKREEDINFQDVVVLKKKLCDPNIQ